MANYGLLYAAMTPPDDLEAEFNAWYDTEHIPERLSAPGFLGARRWVARQAETKYLALYDLESPAALETEAYRKMSGDYNTEWTRRITSQVSSFTRRVYEQIWPGQAQALPDAGALLAVAIEPEPGYEDELNAWYAEEHIGRLLKVPGFRQARRFRAIEGSPKYLALYDLESLDALKPSSELEAAVNTPWSDRIRPHFQSIVRGTYLAYPATQSVGIQGSQAQTTP